MSTRPGRWPWPCNPDPRPAPTMTYPDPDKLRVRTGTWAELAADAGDIRTQVFIHEQGIPQALEWDEDDATAVHAVAYDGQGRALATGRLLRGGTGVAKIGRLAVLAEARRTGLGSRIMRVLMAAARARGDREVVLHAQRSAEDFYLRLGFSARGEPFDEAGIPHVVMATPLD